MVLMKRTALAPILALVMLLLFSCYFSHEVKAVVLGPLWDRSDELNVDDVIDMESPQNTTYSKNEILLKLTVTADSYVYDVGYSIDGGEIERMGNLTKIVEVPADTLLPPFVRVTYSGSITLKGLLDGSHTITVYHGFQYTGINKRYEALKRVSVMFTVDTSITIPPKISLVSIENKTYDTPNIPLNFTINKMATQIKYSLDGEENITISGNTTLTGLANGNHNLTVYATDDAGNTGTSETIDFTVEAPEPESFPITLVVAVSGASLAVVAAALLVYLKKRKREA